MLEKGVKLFAGTDATLRYARIIPDSGRDVAMQWSAGLAKRTHGAIVKALSRAS
jgi:hypothetical protein